MNENVNPIQNIEEKKKDKIFKILNKKHRNNNSFINNIKSPKKNRFILYKPINQSNLDKEIIEKKYNENTINNILHIDNKNNLTNDSKPTNLKKEPLIEESNDINIIGKNKITENFATINNNIEINNINNIKNSEDKNELPKKEWVKTFGDYICYRERKIGSGSFGMVLYGIHKNKSMEVAVKMINSDIPSEEVNKEIYITRKLEKLIGFPKIYYTCSWNIKNIIIESLLGPSIDKLFKYCGRKFPLKTVCLIGIEIVKRLESMHEKGILHRDLKPNNLAWGNYNSSYNNINNYNLNNNNNKLDINTIYLFDFGLSCFYWENGDSTKHYKMKNRLKFIGTLRYASLNSHKGIRQGRRDDLESMLYILIYFLKGKLPWQEIKVKEKEERPKLIFQMKSKTTIESLCQDIPQEFSELLKYVKSLQFEEKPNYDKFYGYFNNLINKLKDEQIQENNFNYIWEKILVDKINKYKENNDEGILQEAENLIFKGYPINLNNFTNYILNNTQILK